MIWIEDGREHLFQWDLDRRLVVDSAEVTEIHYHTSNKEKDLRCEVFEDNGKRVANIPNILLQKSGNFRVYAYNNGYTGEQKIFEIKARCKPEDYIYTETEVIQIEDIISQFIEEYFEKYTFIIDAND